MKTNKTVLIVGAVLVFGVIFYLGRGRNGTVVTDQTEVEEGKESASAEATTGKSGSIFDSIRDAMAKSLSLRCDYAASGAKITAYVKGKMVRVDSVVEGGTNNSSIIKEDMLWSWDNEKKEGIIMPLQSEENKTVSEEIINGLENEKQFCKVAIVADSMFEPPADIKFQDLGQLFQQISGIPQQP